MSHYRDDLDAAHARVSTLEAKLKEREAALDAREAELSELRAELARARRGEAGGLPGDGDARNGQRALLAALAACAFVMAAGYAMMRPRYCYQTSFATPPPAAVVREDADPVQADLDTTLDDATRDPTPAMGEFDRAAASNELAGLARFAKSCKRPGGPSGAGRVKVTFLPQGRVSTVQVQGAPYAGSLVGTCVEAIFRGATVPPFDGPPVSVTKSFSID